MPASQLAQLKAALAGTGLNRQSTSKKDKKAFKKGGSREVDRQKKFDKLEEIRRGLNKFDERETRVKHDVGGRRLQGVTGRPSAAKQAGLDRRRQNLLPEHQLRHHTGTFNDRRFGENNPTLTAEEREQERYTRERQKGQGKKGMFNLEDSDEDIFGFEEEGGALGGLTHGGRSVADMKRDDFDGQGLGDDEGDDEGERGRIGRKTVERGHFGGFEDGENDGEGEGEERKKTRQEVMSEVIAKSKEHKFARQQQAELDTEMREALDAEMDDLQALLQNTMPARQKPRPLTNGGDEPSAGPSRATIHPDRQILVQRDEELEYDQVVRELAFDARAKPKDRTRTEDEIALDEKEQLEAAEAKRLRRMRGEESEEEDSRGRKRRKDGRGDADDLDDDFVEDDDLLGPGLTREDIENMDVPPDDVEDEEEDGESEGESDEEVGDDEDSSEASSMADLDDDAPELLPGDSDVEDSAVLRESKKAVRKASKQKESGIPFTFPCPATIEEFEDILEPLDDSAIPIVIQRIRALHHPSLAQGNKEKLQNFLGVLLDFVLILAARVPSPTSGFQIISLIQPHLVALVKLNPITAAENFIAKLVIMQKNLTRGLARGANATESKTWPGAAELALLRIIGKVWSTSDFSHPVVAPAVLLMGQYLSQARVRSLADLASGLFLCSILSQYEEESKRIVPEGISFIGSAILVLLPRRKEARHYDPYPEITAPGVKLALAHATKHREPVSLLDCLVADSTVGPDLIKADLLALSLRLASQFAGLYSGHEAFIEILEPIRRILEDSRVAKLHPDLKNLHTNTLSTISRQLHFAHTARVPLTLQSHKPIPIATHLPKFEDDFVPGKSYDPDSERVERAKLKSAYKKERKGAIRELRKDNRFLAGVKAAEQKEKDAGYNARMRKVEGSIQKERAEEKVMEREKKRAKHRAGK